MTETRDWSVPTPVRALLWWPAISFVLVVAFPDAATGVIVGAGAVLAVTGGLVGAATRRLQRPARAEAAPGPVGANETTVEILTEMPTREIPPVDAQVRESPGRAA